MNKYKNTAGSGKKQRRPEVQTRNVAAGDGRSRYAANTGGVTGISQAYDSITPKPPAPMRSTSGMSQGYDAAAQYEASRKAVSPGSGMSQAYDWLEAAPKENGAPMLAINGEIYSPFLDGFEGGGFGWSKAGNIGVDAAGNVVARQGVSDLDKNILELMYRIKNSSGQDVQDYSNQLNELLIKRAGLYTIDPTKPLEYYMVNESPYQEELSGKMKERAQSMVQSAQRSAQQRPEIIGPDTVGEGYEGSYLDFRDKHAQMESERGGKPGYWIGNDYGANGKYQFTEWPLRQFGLMDSQGDFTPLAHELGIYNWKDFRNHPKLQEALKAPYDTDVWDQMMSVGLGAYVGTVVDGVLLTPARVLAAGGFGKTETVRIIKSGDLHQKPQPNPLRPVSDEQNPNAYLDEYMLSIPDYDVRYITEGEHEAWDKNGLDYLK